MIELTQWSKPHQIPLPYGLAVTVQPLNTSGMAAAQAAARRSVEAVERRAHGRKEAGLPLDGLPDLSAEGDRDGFHQAQLIRELAVRQQFTLRQVLLNAARNGSALSAAGTSSRTEGPNTAEPAETTTCPRQSRARFRRPALSRPRTRLDQPTGA